MTTPAHKSPTLRSLSKRRLLASMSSALHLFESLERRDYASATPIAPIDGIGNNIKNPTWGAVNVDFLRVAPADYADGISAPAGEDRPSAREISNTLNADTTDGNLFSARELSDMVYVWGQFIDHDLDLTLSIDSSDPAAEAFNIAVPTGDASFDPTSTGSQVIPFTRSGFDPSTGTSTSNVRQQVNQITAFLDGSMVYGSDETTAASLRTFEGGKLKTSDGDLLPVDDESGMFIAGDVRVNENPRLTAMHTIFVREHNRIAAELAQKNPALTDEQLYQGARRVVIAEIQAVTYNEYLPALLGRDAIRKYSGYKAKVNPGITNEFATAAYRFGHSMLDNNIEFVADDGTELADQTVSLADAFFNPTIIKDNGIDTLLKGAASDNAQEIDLTLVDAVRNFLFGPPGAGGLDLAALNIQRGRDHGLADYNTTRAAYGLKKVTSFAQITSDADTQTKLQSLYGTVDNIDLWVGLLAEDHLPGASVGQLMKRILVDQFTRTRDGDRFWYENNFKGRQLDQIRRTKLSDIIERNTSLTSLQPNVFVWDEDAPGNSQNPPPPPPPQNGGRPPVTNPGQGTQPPPQQGTGPQQGGPQTGGPQNTGPQQGGPQTGGPQNTGPQTGGGQQGGPQQGGPQQGGPRGGNGTTTTGGTGTGTGTGTSGPQVGGPQTGGPQSGGPQTGGPKSGGPQQGGPQNTGTQTGGGQQGGTQQGGPQQGGPRSGNGSTGSPQTNNGTNVTPPAPQTGGNNTNNTNTTGPNKGPKPGSSLNNLGTGNITLTNVTGPLRDVRQL